MFVTGKAAVLAMGAWIYKVIIVDSVPKPTVMSEWMALPNCAGIHTSPSVLTVSNELQGKKNKRKVVGFIHFPNLH